MTSSTRYSVPPGPVADAASNDFRWMTHPNRELLGHIEQHFADPVDDIVSGHNSEATRPRPDDAVASEPVTAAKAPTSRTAGTAKSSRRPPS